MKLLELLRRESTAPLRTLLLFATVGGVASALILPVINAAAKLAAHREVSLRLFVIFAIVVVVYAISQRYFMERSIDEVERMLDRLRVRIADKIRHCDLQPLEEIGRTAIYVTITKETTTISQAALTLVINLQFAVLTVVTAIYVLFLSPIAFILTIASTAVVVLLYRRQLAKINAQLHQTARQENALFEALTHMLEGFKEVRLNRARSDDLYHDLATISHDVADTKSATMAQVSTTFVFSQIFFYLLLGVIVFIVPRLSTTYSDQVVQITTAVLFLIGPITSMVSSAQSVVGANASAENIAAIEGVLDRSATKTAEAPAKPRRRFREIRFENVVFHYPERGDGGAFTVGPLDFTLREGEIVFITGGNGSGKSTFLKLLTGLYFPTQGVIRVDGEALTPAGYDSYRSLFSTVFTDFHLFRRLYGLYDVPQETIDRDLALIELADKTRVVDSTFETLDLSGGQRKRISLLVAMLEDRPIEVFDEVAADQDPAFRRKFYQEILPMLKERGKTIVAVTHDDRYFEDADRRLKMEEGRFAADAPA